MSPGNPPSGGILASLRNACDQGAALLQNRIELFGVELQEQRARLLKLLLLGAVGVCLANLAAVLVVATVVVLAGEQARGVALIALSLLAVLATAVVFLLMRKVIRSAPPPFKDTLSEIEKDRDWLNPRK